MNALKSGIHAQSEIIPGEDPAELTQLTAEYYDSIQPQGREEAVFVDQVISADWKLRRFRRAEADIWTDCIERQKNNKTPYGSSYEYHQEKIDRLYRNQASVARTLRASLDSLLRLRKDGLLTCQNEPNLPDERSAHKKPPKRTQFPNRYCRRSLPPAKPSTKLPKRTQFPKFQFPILSPWFPPKPHPTTSP
jgi:hypothetical protein